MAPPKKGIGLLIGIGPKKGDSEMPPPPDDDTKKLAAQGLIDAVNSGDAEEVAEAFKTLMDACSGM